MSRRKYLDLAVVILCPVVAMLVVSALSLSFPSATLLFFGLPALYIGIRNPRIVRKSTLFGVLFGVPFWAILDPIATYTGAWLIPSTAFPFSPAGATLENLFFGICWPLCATLFYEHFLDGGRGRKISPHIRPFLAILVPVAIAVVAAFYLRPNLLDIPYFFAVAGVLLVAVPLLAFLYEFPAMIRKFLPLGLYFAFLLFLFEITAVRGGLWTFPGSEFIGWVSFAGAQFPFEEMLFWVLIATPALLVYYELFADDRR